MFPATSVTVTFPLIEIPSVVSTNGLGIDVKATPDRVSAVVKAKLTFVLFHPAAFAVGFAAAKMSVGGVLSILKPGDVNVALLPATSLTVTVPVTEAPSAAKFSGLGIDVDPKPDRASAAVNGTDTLVLFQPAAFGAGVADPNVNEGGVLSILMLEAVAGGLTFPALSVQVPKAD